MSNWRVFAITSLSLSLLANDFRARKVTEQNFWMQFQGSFLASKMWTLSFSLVDGDDDGDVTDNKDRSFKLKNTQKSLALE